MKRMLINATQEEELRMAMVDGQRLFDLNIELPSNERKKANIYKGQITRIEPSLEAAFVNYGAERHGFLPLKEISSEYFVREVAPGTKPNIRDVLKEGQDIVVQIDKEERGNKGAALTTFVSLAGRFIVLKPNKSRSGGVSRRIVGEERDLARDSMREVDVPKGMSVILRTAGIERSAEELTWDIENLLAVWEAIKKVIVERPSPFLVYRESNAVVRALRDYLSNDIGEILIDDEATYKEAREFVEQVMPHNLRKLKHYTDAVPLFTRYQIESQIESAFAHTVTLPSGGSLVIDHTEALVSVDINSARATKGGDIEATALNTNLEAADEIARQLRLRDLGGLVVIDFIDMGPQRNQREVENRLRDAVRQDRARVQIGKISRFGLLEMSRQRLRPSLGESSYLVCPRCSGIGNIRSVESLALAILRIIGEEARKERTAKVIAQLPVEVATYMLNEKRDWVQGLESRHGTQVILVANPALETPHYQVRRVRDDQVDLPENVGISYTLAETDEEPEIMQAMQDKKPAEIAAITTVVTTTPAPPRREPVKESGPGLWQRIVRFFSSSSDDGQSAARKSKSGRRRDSRTQDDGKRRDGNRGRKRGDVQRQQSGKGSQRSRPKSGKKRGKKSANSDADRNTAQQSGQQPRQNQEARDDNDLDGRNETRKTTGKRRSRGGRRRRKNTNGKDNAAQTQQGGEQVSTTATADTESPKPQRKKSRRATSRNQDNTDDASQSSAPADQARPTSHAESSPRNSGNDGPAIVAATGSQVARAQPVATEATDASRAAAASSSQPSSVPSANPARHEDSQAQSPAVSNPRDDAAQATQAARPADAAPAKAENVVAERTTQPASGDSNGEGKAAGASTADTGRKPPEQDKPVARLLPWEPVESPPRQPAEKE